MVRAGGSTDHLHELGVPGITDVLDVHMAGLVGADAEAIPFLVMLYL